MNEAFPSDCLGLLLSGLRKNAMVAIHQELNRLTGPEPSSWISQGHRKSSLLSESPAAAPSRTGDV